MSMIPPDLPTVCVPVDWGCAPQGFVDELDPDVKARAEALASEAIRMLTAYQVGNCPIIVRPCSETCVPRTWVTAPVGRVVAGSILNPVNLDGRWLNVVCGHGGGCGTCAGVPEVVLDGPVADVRQVVIDGAVLDPSAYRVDNGNRLVRTDGDAWPMQQDLTAAWNGPGAFAVEYVRGQPVDGLVSYAAGLLAVEYAKACQGGKCRLPSNVVAVTRQGVSFEMAQGAFPGGLSGIYEVDMITGIYNPNRLRTTPSVLSPDIQRPRQTTWSAT